MIFADFIYIPTHKRHLRSATIRSKDFLYGLKTARKTYQGNLSEAFNRLSYSSKGYFTTVRSEEHNNYASFRVGIISQFVHDPVRGVENSVQTEEYERKRDYSHAYSLTSVRVRDEENLRHLFNLRRNQGRVFRKEPKKDAIF